MRIATAIVRALIALLFIYYVAAFAWSVAGRISYPYELEYFEGSTYLHTQRVIDGEGLFVDPNENFIAYPYTPLYYIATIPFTWIFGQNIIAGRVLSLISLLFIGLLIWRALYQSTGSKLAGLFAFGMYLSLYYITGAWYDICRIDMFLCALLVGTVYFLKDFPGKKWGLIPSALFLIAAVFTKQVGIVFFVFIFPYIYTRDKRAACFYFLGVLGVTLAISGIANALSDGWFKHYIYDIPQHRQFHLGTFWDLFIVEDIVGKVPILFAGSLLWVFIRNSVAGKRTPLNIWEWTLPAALLASALPRSQPGGFENNLLPFFLWCSIMFGFFIYHLPGYFTRLIGAAADRERKKHWLMWQLIVYNFLLAQLILIFFIPTAFQFPRRTDYPIIPSKEDRAAGDNVIAYISSFPGEVYLPVHNYYGWIAGKTPGIIASPAMEHMKAGGTQPQTFYDKIQGQEYDAIILNEHLSKRRLALSYEKAIFENYYWAGDIPWDTDREFLPVTGLRTRPNDVMLPVEIMPGIEGLITHPPMEITRDVKTIYAVFTSEGNLYLIDPVEFTSDEYKLPFSDANPVGATSDGRLAIAANGSLFLMSEGDEYESFPLTGIDKATGYYEFGIDPMGEFVVVADKESGQLKQIQIPTGELLDVFRIGPGCGRILITSDGSTMFLNTRIARSIEHEGKTVATLQRYVINRQGEHPVLLLDADADMPDLGREMRFNPASNLLYWFNPKKATPSAVFDADTLDFQYHLRGRGWLVRDIAFSAEPGKLFVHFSTSDNTGVAILDPSGGGDFGQARLYDKPGWITTVEGTDNVVYFGAGDDRVLRFRIYPIGSWPGEQGFKPE